MNKWIDEDDEVWSEYSDGFLYLLPSGPGMDKDYVEKHWGPLILVREDQEKSGGTPTLENLRKLSQDAEDQYAISYSIDTRELIEAHCNYISALEKQVEELKTKLGELDRVLYSIKKALEEYK